MNLTQIEKDWKSRGFSFGVWEDPAGQRWEGYVHEVNELFMVVEGDVELEMKGQKLRPKSGEEILIPVHTTHSVQTSLAAGSRWLYGYRVRFYAT
jgi:mannose-6-phosphate isomerase-like protein (cupin superfamily)